MSLNKVLLIGRLGRDADLKYTKSGNAIGNMAIATDESYTSQDGNRVQKTEWHKVIVYGKQAENCHKFLGKGSLVYIEGKIQTRKWQDKQGQDRYSTEIIASRIQFLDRRDGQETDEQTSKPRADWKGKDSHKSIYDNDNSEENEVDQVPF